MGFEPIRRDVPTLGESLRAAGYLKGIFAKVPHITPQEKFCWDVVVKAEDLGLGRAPELYYRHTRAFLEKAKSEGKPFFLMANSQDPHRPFAGSPVPSRRPNSRRQHAQGAGATVQKTYQPSEVEVPCFLPDLPEVRKELAQYYASVHRCDRIVGGILRALDEAGGRDSTIVMFLSDNGIAFPFAKTNCYPFSTRTPWIVRWPGTVRPGTVDTQHFISGIDFLPTVLEALNLPPVPGIDGRSFVPLLRGRDQEGRDRAYTFFHATSAGREFPMRSIQSARFCYIYSSWSDGKTVFQNEARGSSSFKAMDQAAEQDPAVAARVKLFSYRAPEELYDLEKDPCCFHNLVNDPAAGGELERMRREMDRMMEKNADPLLKDYKALVRVK
jgi:N-sulfoglucosamine sulfohydrolase